jgi:phage regulator Rha-like protein
LKAILGGVSSCVKFQLESGGANRDFNTCIALSDFERVLRHFDRKGNETAAPTRYGAVLTDDDSLYVTARSVASLFQIPQNNIHRDLKAILGDVSRFLKISVDEKVKGNPVNTCIALSDFERVLRYSDRKGNETAAPMRYGAVLTDDGSLYVTAQSVASLFNSRQNHASRDLKAILGEGLILVKISVDKKVNGNPVNTCIALSDFERVLRYFDRKGNETAAPMRLKPF